MNLKVTLIAPVFDWPTLQSGSAAAFIVQQINKLNEGRRKENKIILNELTGIHANIFTVAWAYSDASNPDGEPKAAADLHLYLGHGAASNVYGPFVPFPFIYHTLVTSGAFIGSCVYLMSCDSGKELAPLMVQNGNVSAVFANDIRVFAADVNTPEIRFIDDFTIGMYVIPSALLLGATMKEALQQHKAYWGDLARRYDRSSNNALAKIHAKRARVNADHMKLFPETAGTLTLPTIHRNRPR